MVVEFIKTNLSVQNDEQSYHDSLQARLMEGLVIVN